MTFRLNYCAFVLITFTLLAGCSTSRNAQSPEPGETYTNAFYNIALEFPTSWVLVEEDDLEVGDFAINIFSKGTAEEDQLPLNVHAQPQHSYVTIWPKGFGTELPYSQYAPFDKANRAPVLSFKADASKSKILKLEDGDAWAYFIVPTDPPTNWSKDGFIFAQIRMTNPQTLCYDEQTDQQKPMEECNSIQGDKIVRKGDRNEQDMQIIHDILGSLSLEEIESEETASDMIEVEKPLPNMEVSPPLTVTGKAKGYWYFGGTFLIKLYDANDNLLAEQPVEAQDQWTTEEFVPFETTITFNAPDDQRGRLVFERANPSGLPENDQSYTLPVIFPPE